MGIGLFLLSIALWVGPIVAAFAANGWDLKATVMPSEDQMSEITDQIEGLFDGDFSEDVMEFTDNQINLGTGEFRVTVQLQSPFNIDVKIKSISLEVSCEQHDVPLGSVQMEESEVNVPANGTATFTLVGTLTSAAIQHITTVHGGDLPGINSTDMVLELEFYGVAVSIENMEWG